MEISDQIIYEDNHLLAINKLCGQITQGDKSGDEPLPEMIKEYIKRRDNKPGNVFCGVIHRLDRPVSGVVLFAKTSKALSRMNETIKNRAIQKTYWAISKGTPLPPDGELKDWLLRNEANNKTRIVDITTPGAKLAELDYHLACTTDGGYNMIEVMLHTGRHHQIRAQLANIGCPIKGDLKYGAARSNPDGGISLHARSISFIHPVRQEPVTITAAVPDDPIWHQIEQKMKEIEQTNLNIQ